MLTHAMIPFGMMARGPQQRISVAADALHHFFRGRNGAASGQGRDFESPWRKGGLITARMMTFTAVPAHFLHGLNVLTTMDPANYAKRVWKFQDIA